MANGSCGWRVAFLLLAASLCSAPAHANSYALPLLVTGLSTPVALANAGDGSNRLFIVEQSGTIRVFDGSQLRGTPFLDIHSKVLSGGERGLLGLAFDASYRSNGYFYVYYTSQTAGDVTIARYSVSADPNIADPASELILKTQAHPTYSNHNGGSLAFGSDGCLYAGLGDGGGGGDPDLNGQNLATLLGKIIRINPSDGSPCAGNPFIGQAGARPEIWALGVRNPWRISFDRATGDLFIADVGQSQREEVNVQPAGAGGRNYCWRHKEGTLIYDADVPCTTGTPTDPVLDYGHDAGNCSITGGYRYRGSKHPGMSGIYFYGDYCSGRIWGAKESAGTWTTSQLLDTTLNISSFGEDEAGEIYVVSLGGAIYRLVALSAHDIDGDGKSDIAWRNNAGTPASWLMNGAQVQQSGAFGAVSGAWQIVGQRDFDGDGKVDWLWRNGSTGAVALWFLNGVQVAATGAIGAVAPNWVIAGTGDFDGDGRGDILWRDTTNGNVAIWLMNGLQISQSGSLGTVAGNWTIAGIGDANADGMADIVWRDNSTGAVAIWFLNGLQVLQSGTLGAVTGNWRIAGVGDFDGDGRSDLLWRDDNNGTVALWLLDGLRVTRSGALGTVAANWTLAGTGDFNGDGKSDLLWRETTNGTVAIWLMNGLQLLQPLIVGSVDLDWAIQGLNSD